MSESHEHGKSKKPLNIIALAMVFLCLSIVFVSLSYGFGKAEQAKEDKLWYGNIQNLNNVVSSLGYTMTKIPVIEQQSQDSLISHLGKNISNLNLTV